MAAILKCSNAYTLVSLYNTVARSVTKSHRKPYNRMKGADNTL